MRYLKHTVLVIAFLCGVSLLGMPFAVRAQLTPQEAARINNDDIALNIDPEIPGANQDVTFSLNSYLTDLNRALISWDVNGKKALTNYGAFKFTIHTGAVGEKMTVKVNMILVSGESLTKTVVVDPSELNLVWEGADAYIPPFYKGRALPTSEGTVRVLAIPQIGDTAAITDTSNYVFHWKKNDAVLTADSGYAKSALVFQQDYLNPQENIEVTGQNNTTGEVGQGKAVVSVYDPKILMYVRDPIFGIDWAHEVGSSFDVTTSEKTIIAIPYFFSPFNPLSSDLTYKWTINGDDVPAPSVPNVFTLKSGSSKGVSILKLAITNRIKLFLDGDKTVTVNLK